MPTPCYENACNFALVQQMYWSLVPSPSHGTISSSHFSDQNFLVNLFPRPVSITNLCCCSTKRIVTQTICIFNVTHCNRGPVIFLRYWYYLSVDLLSNIIWAVSHLNDRWRLQETQERRRVAYNLALRCCDDDLSDWEPTQTEGKEEPPRCQIL